MKYLLQFFLATLCFVSNVKSQDFKPVDIPDWVKPYKIPEESSVAKYDITSGFYLKLLDFQANLEADVTFNREVRNVLSYSGVTNASQISVTYDTSYQKLNIHHLHIWRKGKKIDRTDDLSFEIMNNEYNLDVGIYEGNITAYDNLNDIRKDDLIDFAYSIKGSNPIFNGEKYLFIPLDALNPVDKYAVRILYPEEKEYSYRCKDCDSIQISEKETEGYKEIEIINKNLKALKIEDNTPSWTIPFRYFSLSSLNSWTEVNKWAQKVFDLESEPQLQTVFDEIFTGEESLDEKINKSINYVQNEIRYMGIESGIGSIKPFPPEQVVKQRFGDCKDKSLLLVSLLKQIGISEAYPALVNTMWQHELQNQFPSNQVFNHCIVTFEYDSNTYWIDPSRALQGGNFKELYIEDYEKALIVGKPSDSLQKMHPSSIEGRADVVEELTVHSFTEPATLKITSSRYGFEADNRRAYLEYFSAVELSDQVTNDLKLQYPTVNKTSELEITDDYENNALTVEYNYEVDGFWQERETETDNFWVYHYEPRTLYPYLNKTNCEDRTSDFQLNYPLNLSYRMIFHLPEKMLIMDDVRTFDNEAFYFEEKIKQTGNNSFQVDYLFKIKTKCLEASKFKLVCEEINNISEKLPVIIYFSK